MMGPSNADFTTKGKVYRHKDEVMRIKVNSPEVAALLRAHSRRLNSRGFIVLTVPGEETTFLTDPSGDDDDEQQIDHGAPSEKPGSDVDGPSHMDDS
jgi:hypothetical protein